MVAPSHVIELVSPVAPRAQPRLQVEPRRAGSPNSSGFSTEPRTLRRTGPGE